MARVLIFLLVACLALTYGQFNFQRYNPIRHYIMKTPMRRSYNTAPFATSFMQPPPQSFGSLKNFNPMTPYVPQNKPFVNYPYKTATVSLPTATTRLPVTVSNKFKQYFSYPRQIMFKGKPYIVKFVPTQSPPQSSTTQLQSSTTPTVATTLTVPQSTNPYPYEFKTVIAPKNISYQGARTIYVKRPKNGSGGITPEIYSSVLAALKNNKTGENEQNRRRVVYLVMDDKNKKSGDDSATDESRYYASYDTNVPQGYITYPTRVVSGYSTAQDSGYNSAQDSGYNSAQNSGYNSAPKAPFTPSPFLGLSRPQGAKSIQDILITNQPSGSYGAPPTQSSYGAPPQSTYGVPTESSYHKPTQSSYGVSQSTYGTQKPNVALEIANLKEQKVHTALKALTNAVQGKAQKHKAIIETILNPGHSSGYGPESNENLRALIKSVKSALTRLKAKKALKIGSGLNAGSHLLNAVADPLENIKVPSQSHYGASSVSATSGGLKGLTSLVTALIPSTSGNTGYGASAGTSYGWSAASTQKPSLIGTFNEALDGIKETKKNVLEAIEKITDSFQHPFTAPVDKRPWSFSNTLKGGYSTPVGAVASSSNIKEQYSNVGETLFTSVSNILSAFKAPFDMINQQYGSTSS